MVLAADRRWLRPPRRARRRSASIGRRGCRWFTEAGGVKPITWISRRAVICPWPSGRRSRWACRGGSRARDRPATGARPSTISRELPATAHPAAARVPGLDRAGPGRPAGSAAETSEAGDQPAVAGRGAAGWSQRQPRADRPPAARGLPRRSGDAGVARDDLPVAVRAGPRSAAPGADRLSAHRPGAARPRAAPGRRDGSGHGQHLRAARRGRGPGGARALGGRPDHRQRPASAIGTLVERATRFVLLLHLPGDHGAETVREPSSTRSPPCPRRCAGR